MAIKVELARISCIEPEERTDELLVLTHIQLEGADRVRLASVTTGDLVDDMDEDEEVIGGQVPPSGIERWWRFGSPPSPDHWLDTDALAENGQDVVLADARRIRMHVVGLEIDGIRSTAAYAIEAKDCWFETPGLVTGGHDVLWELQWNLPRRVFRDLADSGTLPETQTLDDSGSTRSYQMAGNGRRLIETTRIVNDDDDFEYVFVVRYEWEDE